jgi:hypothetical protein
VTVTPQPLTTTAERFEKARRGCGRRNNLKGLIAARFAAVRIA